jgi:hypothetical protein
LAFKLVIAAELGAAPTAEAMKPGTAIDIHFDGDLACRGFVDRYQPRSDGHEGREILELVQRSVRLVCTDVLTIIAPLGCTIEGPLTVTQTLNVQNLDGAPGTATIHGDIAVIGALSTTASVAAGGDVTAGSISLEHHVHGGVLAGGANTTGPH